MPVLRHIEVSEFNVLQQIKMAQLRTQTFPLILLGLRSGPKLQTGLRKQTRLGHSGRTTTGR